MKKSVDNIRWTFGWSPRRIRAVLPLMLAMAMGAMSGGCASSSGADADEAWSSEGRLVFADDPGGGGAGAGSGTDGVDGREGWGILLETFSGAGHVERARQRREQVARALGRTDVYAQVRSRGSVVVLGSYSGPNDPRAQRDLRAVQSVTVAGRRPYERSYLSPPPPPPTDVGDLPELNLLSARRLVGSDALYTLQVAVFEGRNHERAKRDAEKHALTLRQRGEMAFYYHGPTKSMVTIGIFGEQAYDAQAQQVSLEVQSLQRRFPLNLLNGDEEIPEPTGSSQASMLVLIPK